MVHEHDEEAAAVGRAAVAAGVPGDPQTATGATDEEHAQMRAALDRIEAALDEAAATISRMA